MTVPAIDDTTDIQLRGGPHDGLSLRLHSDNVPYEITMGRSRYSLRVVWLDSETYDYWYQFTRRGG